MCIGDRWRLGEALLEVSQPRKPCWKLNVRFGLRIWPVGCRRWRPHRLVLPGAAAGAGRARHPAQETSSARTWTGRSHGCWRLCGTPGDEGTLAEMASLTVLAPAWRDPARRRLVTGEIKASTARLVTPTVGGDDPAG